MQKNAIISLADAKYFDLLDELVDSIRYFKQSEKIDICILDAGLTEDQLLKLSTKVHSIKKAEWDIEVSSFKVMGKEWLKSQVSRAFLPKYFPNYDKYLWIDADAWVNSWEAINLYFKGCENKKLSISTSADRAYGRVLRAEWVFGSFARIKSQNYKHAKSSGFSEEVSRSVALMPHLNIGVFALEADAPHWNVWQKNLETALQKGNIWGSEQIAMNITIYFNNLNVEILPAYCNWTQIGKIKFDKENKTLVEPYLPHHEIGIVHFAGKNNNEIRNNKNFVSKVKTLNGDFIDMKLRFNKN